jgi:hypothetical protein
VSNSIPGARPVGAIKAHALPFLLGVAAGAYVLYGAGQDQLAGLSGLAPAAVFLATLAGENLFVFGILLNGILYALTAAAIQRLWATRRWLSVLTAILAGLWAIFPLLGSWEAHQLQPNTEVVMTPGMRIIATTPNGPLTITAGQGTRRSYSDPSHFSSQPLSV